MKAAVKYFRDLAFGRPEEKVNSRLILDPEFGTKRSESFQSKHGRFGERLVDLLGSGASRDKLIRSNAIDQ